MELTKFLSLCGMLAGVVATVFLSKVLFASADSMLRGTYHYSAMGWPSVAILSSMTGQKADTLSSIIFVLLALFFQLCSTFVKNDIYFTSLWQRAAIIAVVLIGVITLTVYYVGIGAKKSFELEIKRLAAKDYITSAINERSCPLYVDVRAIADQYFGFKKEDKEKDSDFVKRFASYLGYEVPENTDFSKFK